MKNSHASSSCGSKTPQSIAFIHVPFFGLTGSDALIVNSALNFQENGYKVKIYTMDYHRLTRHFAKASLLDVESYSSVFPRSIAGFGCLFFCLLNSIWFTFMAFSTICQMDLIICDNAPYCIIFLAFLLRLFNRRPHIVYYCHFPIAGASNSANFFKRFYKKSFNFLEKKASELSDVVYGNSTYTKEAILSCHPSLQNVKLLYPGIPNLEPVSSPSSIQKNIIYNLIKDSKVLLSINRYDPRKKFERILLMTSVLKKKINEVNHFITIIAGGMDLDIKENVAYFGLLKRQCDSLSLSYSVVRTNELAEPDFNVSFSPDVIFLHDASMEQISFLLKKSDVFFYSSSFEHFGLGIIEAMFAHCFTIAMTSGGPLEIIKHMENGYLIPEPSNDGIFKIPKDLLAILTNLLSKQEMDPHIKEIIESGHAVVLSSFTIEAFNNNILVGKIKK